MREILFRAKSKLHGDFVYGNYADGVIFQNFSNMGFEKLKAECWSPIDVDTLGQYTGSKDKNGDRIFENDILTCGDENIKYRVVFTEDCSFMGQQMNSINGKDTGCCIGLNYWKDKIEIIGNIHDKDTKGR